MPERGPGPDPTPWPAKPRHGQEGDRPAASSGATRASMRRAASRSMSSSRAVSKVPGSGFWWKRSVVSASCRAHASSKPRTSVALAWHPEPSGPGLHHGSKASLACMKPHMQLHERDMALLRCCAHGLVHAQLQLLHLLRRCQGLCRYDSARVWSLQRQNQAGCKGGMHSDPLPRTLACMHCPDGQ